jgi:hypothetical protein
MKHGIEYRFDQKLDDSLRNSIRHRGDGQRELHTRSMSIWDGLRSVIRFIPSGANTFPC